MDQRRMHNQEAVSTKGAAESTKLDNIMQFMQMQQKQLQSDQRDYRDSYRERYRGNYRGNRQGYDRENIHVRNRGEVQNNYHMISSTE